MEVEEKYRKAMVSNAQLDNEKTNLIYQVDTLRESLMEMEEILCESRRECEDKNRVRHTLTLILDIYTLQLLHVDDGCFYILCQTYERELHAHSVLKVQFDEVKETLKQSEELLTVSIICHWI